jgi:eukaryotic-like serine/threonine-protein kinase
MLCSVTAPPPPVDPPPVDPLLDGRYRLGHTLGTGGVADVYRAVDERLQRDVAVKWFRGDVAEQLSRYDDEMRTLARLNHPSLVTVFDAGTDSETGRPYLVMELIDGKPLSDHLLGGPLGADRTAQVGASVADALAYVHGQGLLHRDVKPANILLSADGRVHLADFGIARLIDSARVTAAGDVVGTPAYFAPEQVAGEPVGPPADVYALGLVLLECITGQREYEGMPLEAAMARLNRQPVMPPNLSPGWRDLLGGMTARQPLSRLSAAQAADRLHRLANGDDRTVALTPADATTVMPTVEEPTPAPEPTKRSRRGLWIALAVIVVLVIVGVIVGLAASNNKNNNKAATGNACGPGTPQLSGRLEIDMQNLENLSCR